jgi:hypothetical protein
VTKGDYECHLRLVGEFGSGYFIQEFVSVGQNYEFSVFCPSKGKRTTKGKVKGITLN